MHWNTENQINVTFLPFLCQFNINVDNCITDALTCQTELKC